MISAHYCLSSLNDNAIQNCLENIKQVISTTDIILLIIKSANKQQFRNINDILQSSFDQFENLKQKKDINFFNNLPSTTVYQICDFLNRNDMHSLKMCCMSLLHHDVVKNYAVL